MKAFLLALLLLAALPAAAHDGWTQADTAREAVYATLIFIDAKQTHEIANHDLHEQNSVLGAHPSDRSINTYFAATLALQAYIVYLLPEAERAKVQYLGIALEGYVVRGNVRLGLAVKF